ncbi:hypothetical protein ACFQI7_26435 [Paenibacillus allorhizosphaerae]|uniref:Glycosyltransferase RgtA/B/C/D-like domain-containing protein n=1 Tax=Paenibacillus allorhizosphaerae TaxID=2849866 RepID=A0ABM8VM75_9BACL|nr:hypothetical protein [Paenibacillus allorhizosphaerae]CAG7649540.1 hypothetical protein PAECIP111802_04515 [Paenibacillus allorhizosphaerae]
MRKRLASISQVTGLTLLMTAVAAFAVPSLLFVCGLPVQKAWFWIAALLALGTGWLASRHEEDGNPVRLFAISAACSALIFAVSFMLSGYFYDLSYDGQAYHQETMIFLANGWNPVYDEPLSVPTGHSLWMNHYARASEIAATAFYKATGLLEHSKLFNSLLIAASGCLSFSALVALRPGNSPFVSAVVAALLALNPVSVYQAFSFYVDGMVASLLLCLLALGVMLFVRGGWLPVAAYTLTLIMTINVKFTAFGYAGVLTAGLIVALYMSEQFQKLKRVFTVAAAGTIVGVVLIGYNPYVTNTLNFGHPFYPVAGEDKIDVVQNFTPRNLEKMNPLEQMAASYFAVTTGNSTEKKPTKFKWPFTFSENELTAFAEPDVAVSGFGPLFSAVLLLSLIVLVLAFRSRSGPALAASAVIALLTVSVVINPAAWWARYVPQLWVVPLVCVWLALSLQGYRVLKAAGWTLAAVIAVNSLLVTGIYADKQAGWSNELRAQLRQLQAAAQPVGADFGYSWSNRERLKSFGIAFEDISPDSCAGEKLTLIKSGTTVCLNGSGAPGQATAAK